MIISCPACESGNIKRKKVRKTVIVKQVKVELDTHLHYCLDCGQEFWVSGIDEDFMATALKATKEYLAKEIARLKKERRTPV